MATTQPATLTMHDTQRLGPVATASLVVGPLIMSVGDLLHPVENADSARQAVIMMDHPGSWYLAHLLLLVGFALAIPGLLGLTGMVSTRWPRIGRTTQVMILIGATGLSGIFAIEMLAGHLALTDREATQSVLDALMSPSMAIPIFIIVLGFFVGTMMVAVRMIRGARRLRWPATSLLTGTLLIVAEIMSSQVLLSQIGNVLVWGGSAGLAWQLRRGADSALASA